MPRLAYAAIAFAIALPIAIAQEIPDGLRGFSGQVGGIVKERTERGITFQVHVVHQVWRNNEASDPQEMKGQLIEIRPALLEGDDGRARPNELHAVFLHKLEVGEDYRIEIFHREGNWFEILELSEEQRAWARGEEKREEKAEEPGPGWRGFRGLVRGIVRGRKERGIRLEVVEIVQVFPRSEAREPNSLAGQTVDVYPRWRKGDDGQWRPVAEDVRYLARLEEGQDLRIEIANDERDAFHILELPREEGQGGR